MTTLLPTGPPPAAPGRPRLRCLSVPATDPPFDDERAAPVSPAAAEADRWLRTGEAGSPSAPTVVQGTLALAFPPAVPAVPDAAPCGPQRAPGEGDAPTLRVVAPALPAPDRWAARLAGCVLEVLSGERPLVQLARWTSEQVYDELAAQTARQHERAPRAARRPPVIRSVRVSSPCRQVAEVTATAVREGRLQAVALRLEVERGHWRCTALQVV